MEQSIVENVNEGNDFRKASIENDNIKCKRVGAVDDKRETELPVAENEYFEEKEIGTVDDREGSGVSSLPVA